MSAVELPSPYVEWGESFLSKILYVGSEKAQRVHERSYGALLHAFRSGDGVLARGGGEVCREKPHGGACRLDVYGLRTVFQRVAYHLGVVAVGEIVGQCAASRQRVYYHSTVADAL